MGRTLAVICVPPVVDVVGRARLAASQSLVRRLVRLGAVDCVVVAAADAAPWADLDVEVVADPPTGWCFGEQLAGIVRTWAADRLIYFSAGSGFLLSDEELARLTEATPTRPPYAVLNNFYSTDFGLLDPPAPHVLERLARDNPMGFRMWEAGYRCYELPRTVGSQLDIDTPGELQLLACHTGLPGELSAALADVPTEAARALLETLVRPGAQLVVAGRVGGSTLRQLEARAACRVRLVSEERGMESEGRMAEGHVRSLLGVLSELVRPDQLVDTVCGLGDLVVWDTRVLMAHRKLWPRPEERFASDLLRSDEVNDPFLREFTAACAGSKVPMLLGGHTLVSGGMLLALGLAWHEGVPLPPRYAPLALPPQEQGERMAYGT